MKTLRAIAPPVMCLVLGVLAVLAVDHYLFNTRGYQVRAVFDDASGLEPKHAVRIAGSDAGTVDDVKLTKDDRAIVTMTLSHGADGIGSDARATIRSVNILGERYVDLEPGNLDHPEPSGSTIPGDRTGHSVDIDQVIDTLDPETRGRLAILINESGVALDGRGADYNELLRQLPQSLDDGRVLLAGLGADNRKLAALIEQGDQVLASIGPRTTDLTRLVENAGATLQAVADRRAQLGETLRQAPSALRQTRTTLADLGETAQQLRPAATALAATAPVINTTLLALPGFSRDAVPALNSATRNAPLLRQLAEESLPTIRRLRPTADRLKTFAGRQAPLTRSLDRGNITRDLLRFMWGWGRTTRSEDGLGHIFGLRWVIDDDILESNISRLVAGLSNGRRGKAPTRTGARPGAVAPAPKAPDTSPPALPGGHEEKPSLLQTVSDVVKQMKVPKLPLLELPAVKGHTLNDTLDQLLKP